MNKRKGSMVLLSSLLAVSLSLVISSPLAMVWASSNGDDFREIKKSRYWNKRRHNKDNIF